MKEFVYPNTRSDPGKLHKQFLKAGYAIDGIMYDGGTDTTTVFLLDSETKDPASVVASYVYVEPVHPNYPSLYSNAQTVVLNALTQYNTAKSNYATALKAWNDAGGSVAVNTVFGKVTACENMVTACASAVDASKDAIVALAEVVKILAKERGVEPEEDND